MKHINFSAKSQSAKTLQAVFRYSPNNKSASRPLNHAGGPTKLTWGGGGRDVSKAFFAQHTIGI